MTLPRFLLDASLLQPFVYHIPVDDLPKSVQMVWATVLIINVIGVFPNIESQQRPQAFLHGIARVSFLSDNEFPFLINGEPHPA